MPYANASLDKVFHGTMGESQLHRSSAPHFASAAGDYTSANNQAAAMVQASEIDIIHACSNWKGLSGDLVVKTSPEGATK